MAFWKRDRNKFLDNYPYRGPYGTFAEAEEWAMAAALHHTGTFRVIEYNGAFHVEQDMPDVNH